MPFQGSDTMTLVPPSINTHQYLCEAVRVKTPLVDSETGKIVVYRLLAVLSFYSECLYYLSKQMTPQLWKGLTVNWCR